MAEKTVKALPLVPQQYDPVNESINRRTIEQAIQDVNSEIGHVKDMQESGISKAVKRHIFLLMGSSHCCFNGGYISAMLTAGGGISFPDGEKAFFGDGNDLQIYHDGNDSYVEDVGTGHLTLKGQDVKIRNASGQLLAQFLESGAVDIRHAGSAKLTTASGGIDVTGSVTASDDFIGDTFGTSTNKITWSIANNARIFTNGLERFRIDSSGNLGIGTTSPSQTLHVVGNGLYTGGLTVGDSAADTFVTKGHTHLATLGNNVGIGTTSPSEKLHVDGNIKTTGIIYSGGSLRGSSGSATKLILNATSTTTELHAAGTTGIIFKNNGNAERMRLTDTGLGIGTTSPDVKLRVDHDDNTVAFKVTGGGGGANIAEFVRDVGTSGVSVSINGSSARPQIKFVKPSNTFSIGVNSSSFEIADNDVLGTNTRLSIDSSGRVGIGTSLPSAKLDVAGTVNAFGNGSVALQWGDTSAIGALSFDGSANPLIRSYSSKPLVFQTDGANERMRITSSGNVAIGTTSTTSAMGSQRILRMQGTGNNEIILDHTDGGGSSHIGVLSFERNGDHLAHIVAQHDGATDSARIAFNTQATGGSFGSGLSSNERMCINSIGRVGIGTTTPNFLLDVEGTGSTLARLNSTSGAALLQISVPDTGSICDINFGDSGNSSRGQIRYRHTGDSLALSAAGSEALRIDSSGRVLINTTTSLDNNALLHIKGFSSGHAGIVMQDQDNTNARTFFKQTGGATEIQTQNNTAHGIFKVTGWNGSASAEFMRVDGPTGRVGIGTTSPDFQLDVRSAANIQLKLASTSASNNSRMLFAPNNAIKWNMGVNVSDSAFTWFDQDTNTTPVRFEVGASTNTLVVDTASRVGIGTNAPSHTLTMSKDDVNALKLYRPNSASNAAQNVDFNFNTADGSSALYARIKVIAATNTNSAQGGDIAFLTAKAGTITEVMRLTEEGRVGIGTNAPVHEGLEVKFDNPVIRLREGDQTNHFSDIRFNSSALRIRSRANTSNGGIRFEGNNGTSTSEYARFDSSGKLLVGKTVGDTTNTVGHELKANGIAVHTSDGTGALFLNRKTSNGDILTFRKDNTTVGSVEVTGSATTYNTSSDARLKEIKGSARGLEVINELNPVAYDWKADGKSDEGLIAQEVKELVPNAVSETEAGYYQMDYSKLVTPLIKAVQEQQEQIQTLKDEIIKIKGE